jgi:hypothetical protein
LAELERIHAEKCAKIRAEMEEVSTSYQKRMDDIIKGVNFLTKHQGEYF